jgi:hypothetical protein
MARVGGVVGRRGVFAAAGLALYAAAVSRPWRAAVARADRAGCVELHALQDQAVLVAGLLLGFAAAPALVRAAESVWAALLPEDAPGVRRARLRWAAAVVLALGTLANVLWVGQAVDRTVDVHRVLWVEAQLALLVMGVLQAAAWHVLLDEDAPWLALPLTPAMAEMVVATGVVGRGWCG